MRPDNLPSHSYAAAVDPGSVAAEFPPPPYHLERFAKLSRDEHEHIRFRRACQTIKRAYQLSFYRNLWSKVDFEPGDFRALDQLAQIPSYSVHELRESLEVHPPFGSHQAPFGDGWRETPHRIQFSGGTTGMPRPMLYTGHDREVHEILHARQLWAQGVRPGDTAIVSFAYGPHNAATGLHEALYRWLGVLVIPASTGNVTSSVKQLAMAARYGATTLLAMGDYLLHLAQLARDNGYDLRRDFNFRTFPTLGDTDAVERAWGRPAYTHYGTYELAAAAFECEMRGGLHVQEDAYVLQLVHPDDGHAVTNGESGNMVFTSLYHQAYPIVRFNTLDLTQYVSGNGCACGLPHRKIAGFLGRSDTMIKLRGINVWPESLGRIVSQHPASNGEYFCVATRTDQRDEMTVLVETDPGSGDEVEQDLMSRIRATLGIDIHVKVVEAGSLSQRTGLGASSKPRRFEDRRGRAN